MSNQPENVVSNTVTTASQHLEGHELSPFTLSDQKIRESIYATHVHADESLDVDSLFLIVKNIIKRSTQIVDNIVQGIRDHVETNDVKAPEPSFSSPLCTLKSICCELSCKSPGAEIARKSALAILNKLSKYSWDAKAVLTLAAFALEYGEFWQLAQLQHSDQLAKSLAVLRRVPALLKVVDLQNRRQALADLNGLIKDTLQVIEVIFKLKKLYTYDPLLVREQPIALDPIPVHVFWAIITTVSCATKITNLTNDEDAPLDLVPYSQKIRDILNKLKGQLTICEKRIEEAQTYIWIWKLFQTPTEVMEVIKALIFGKDTAQPIIDGSTKKTVTIDILRRKHVLLFISSLYISEDDINVLKPIYEAAKKDNIHESSIVWLPIVEHWTEELKMMFESLRDKMPWYVVQYFSPIAGIRFIKEDLPFKGKPIVVVVNPQGKIENPNALHIIRICGMNAFPFSETKIETVIPERDWIILVGSNIDPNITTWIEEGKYIFFYGGKDNDWIKRFTNKTQTLLNDLILKEAKINIELFCVGKSSEGAEDLGTLGRFWSGIESLFLTKLGRQQMDLAKQEIQKILSYRNENAWAVLSKGSTVVVAGHGFTISSVVDDFEKWKDHVKDKGFEIAFKEYHSQVAPGFGPCSRLDIPSEAGKVPGTVHCHECHRVMETFISYLCCHVDDRLKAHH